jgi:hypothetical protein
VGSSVGNGTLPGDRNPVRNRVDTGVHVDYSAVPQRDGNVGGAGAAAVPKEMTYALECLERLREHHRSLEVAFRDGVPVIRCQRCGHAVVPTPESQA